MWYYRKVLVIEDLRRTDMKDIILRELKKIEEQENVKIIMA